MPEVVDSSYTTLTNWIHQSKILEVVSKMVWHRVVRVSSWSNMRTLFKLMAKDVTSLFHECYISTETDEVLTSTDLSDLELAITEQIILSHEHSLRISWTMKVLVVVAAALPIKIVSVC